MKFSAALLALAAASVSAIDLTPDNWDAATDGKTVFVKMFAPWCGHCKKMKPDWDKLMEEFKDSPTALVGDVDCTEEGKPLCEANGVQGFPTLKYGDPADLQDYQGARDYDSLKKFATENLKPMCGVSNIDLCDDAKKAEIEAFKALSPEDLEAKIAVEETKIADAEKKFEDEVQKLQSAYEKLSSDKDAAIAAVKASGLGLMKSVKIAKAKADKKDEL